MNCIDFPGAMSAGRIVETIESADFDHTAVWNSLHSFWCKICTIRVLKFNTKVSIEENISTKISRARGKMVTAKFFKEKNVFTLHSSYEERFSV